MVMKSYHGKEDNRIPYVYWIKNYTTGLKYVGVRYCKNCHPKDLWVDYFSSSVAVHKLVKLYGKDDFKVKVLHIFDNVDEAIAKEWGYVKLAIQRSDYLNLYNQPAPNPHVQSMKGKIGGFLQRDLRLGIHRQTKEERLELAAKARIIQKELGLNNFLNSTRETQQLRGRIGGPKNKGFRWYTDGITGYKYTRKMQNFLSFEEFLKDNPQYKRGISPRNKEALRVANLKENRKKRNENKVNKIITP